MVSDLEVGAFVVNLDDRHFWDLNAFPEIAELRASRFSGFAADIQKEIVSRLRKGPPRRHWPRKAEADKVKRARLYWTVRELKRIEVGGGKLPESTQAWVKLQIGNFADLESMQIEGGFPEGPKVQWVSPNPDDQYDTLDGTDRLRALEAALSADRHGWDDDPGGRATDWINQTDKAVLILGDLEAAEGNVNDFPRVWNRLGWTHSPRGPADPNSAPRDLQGEANRFLALTRNLTNQTMRAAIEGLSHWLDSWSEYVVLSPDGWPTWQRAWPLAVEVTNAQLSKQEEVNLSAIAKTSDQDREPIDLDTLNAPAGKLVTVLLSACPNLEQVPQPFAKDTILRQIRDAVIAADDRSGLIVRHRLIEDLPYFLRADPQWTRAHLIDPLLGDNNEALALWRAISRRTHHRNVLEIIGDTMVERATDRRLGRETRGRLVFSLIVETLRALSEKREPAVSNSKIQQMLRSIDDEVRARAAGTVVQFVREVSAINNQPSAAELFRSAAHPFLRDVWPQERSLATPGVSKALSDLPAASTPAFGEAVEAIERFLVPFDCWSMMDYGLYGDRDTEDGGLRKLSIIDDETKANALLRLLDLTVGTSEGAVIPYGLTSALDQIQSAAPALAKDPIFRRLSASARRQA